MNKKIDTMPVRQLFEAVLTLETVEECYLFFEDLLTVKEIESLHGDGQPCEPRSFLRKRRI